MNRTRILFVIDNIQFGGGERVFSQLINGLDTDRFKIYLASGPENKFLDAIHNPALHYHPLDFTHRFNPVLIFKLAKMVAVNKIQIVHGQGARAEFHARAVKRISGKPIYISTIAMPVEGFDVGIVKRKVYRFLDNFFEKHVDRYIVVSDALRKLLIQKRNMPANKVVTIFNGIELDHFTPDIEGSSFRDLHMVPENAFLIGAVGRLVWQKGFEYLIRAIAGAVEQNPHLRLFIVGEGSDRRHLIQLVDALNLNQHVTLIKFQKDIKQILSVMDALVVPSLLEGFPMIILEAMAMAKPIIATHINGITEQLVDGESGILVPPKDSEALASAIKLLIRDDEFKYRLGQNARKRVEKEFSVEKMIDETVSIYQSLIETRLGMV